MKSTLNTLLVLVGIFALAYVIYKYRMAKQQGRPFTWDDILSTPNKSGTIYQNGKCYNVQYNSITGQASTTTQVDIKNCYQVPGFQTALQAEYVNIQNRLAAIPNPNDPNDAATRAALQARANEIVNIFKDIKGCTADQNFDMTNLVCIAQPQR